MSATKNDELPLLATISGLKSCQSPLTRITKSFYYDTKSSSKLVDKKLTVNLLSYGFFQVIFGIFSFSLGLILTLSLDVWQDDKIIFPHWPGGLLFTGFGVVSILAGNYPRPRLVLFNVLLNLAAVVLSISFVVLYSNFIITSDFIWVCCEGSGSDEDHSMKNCLLGREMFLALFKKISYMLIFLCICHSQYSIRIVIAGIRLWRSFGTNRNQSPKAPGHQTPVKAVLTKVTILSTYNPTVLVTPPQEKPDESKKDVKNTSDC